MVRGSDPATRLSFGKARGHGLFLLAALVLAAILAGRWLASLYSEEKPAAQTAPAASTLAFADGPSNGQAKEAPQSAEARRRMVQEDLRGRDITDKRLLEVMGRIRRQDFIAPDLREMAYGDHPLPIGRGQTISQPYIVALMTQLAQPKPGDRALEVGTGSGYQAAVLAELCKEVWSIEILRPLAEEAAKRLAKMGYKNVTIRQGDGYRGWPEHAPFDVILVTAAPDHVPQPLVDQLAPGGRLVLPVGIGVQDLVLLEKQKNGSIRRRVITGVRFVPMTGEAEKPR